MKNNLILLAKEYRNKYNDRYKVVGTNLIANDFEFGENFEIGDYNIIHEGCKVGDNVKIENFVLLKKDTKIGNNVYVDSYVKSSGTNSIGNNVTLRFNSTIAREVTIEDDVFIAPNVMTIYSDLNGVKQGGTLIKKGAFIGTNAVLNQAVTVGEKAVVGAMCLVNNNCEDGGIYGGIPNKLIKWRKGYEGS